MYWKRNYIKKAVQREYDSLTSEYYTYIDVESDRKYDNVNPGTVTIEGFGMECWDYELQSGQPRSETIILNCAPVPNIPLKTIFRRLDELQSGVGPLGWDRQSDYDDLEELTRNMG